MKDTERFVKAYRDFRESVDFSHGGMLPEVDNVIGFMLMGIPHVPADEDSSEAASIAAIDQRVVILKAVFVEVNRAENDDFLDEGLNRFDRAGKMAKSLLEQVRPGEG